jgi:hypothetical protein
MYVFLTSGGVLNIKTMSSTSSSSFHSTAGWKVSRRTSRTQTSTTTPWQGRVSSTGASSTPLTTYRPRRRLSSLRRSPCSPGTRLSIRSLLASTYKSGMLITSLQMTS